MRRWLEVEAWMGMLRRPLVLGGDIDEDLLKAGFNTEDAALWLAEHPGAICRLLCDHVRAGCDIVVAPTRLAAPGGCNSLSDGGREACAYILKEAREAAGDDAMVAGAIGPVEGGEFPEWVDLYRDQAVALRYGGADLILIEGMDSLAQCRAAVIGARQAGLAVYVVMRLGDRGVTAGGNDVLASLIVLQWLGVSAYGVSSGVPEALAATINSLAPYARIPLIARLCGESENGGALGEYILNAERLLRAGVGLLGGCCTSVWRRLVDSYQGGLQFVRQQKQELLVADASSCFALEDNFEFSHPVSCTRDMSGVFRLLEEEGCDVMLITLECLEDAVLFAHNARLARLPVAFRSDSAEALELALLLYNGSAVIDPVCDLKEDTLRLLAERYGAVVI